MYKELIKLNFALAFAAVVTASGIATAATGRNSGKSPAATDGSGVTGESAPTVFQKDVAAEQFRRAKLCWQTGTELEHLSNSVKVCNRSHSGEKADHACIVKSRRLETKLRDNSGRAAEVGCSGDPMVVATQYRNAVNNAAIAGDKDAQMCYIQGWFKLSGPSDVVAYKVKASRYMKEAFSRGDWRIVQLLIDASESASDGGAGAMGEFAIIGTPFTIYRSYTLLAHGATGEYATFVNSLASNEKAKLTRAQVQNARKWALQEYKQHFSTSAKLTATPIPCLGAADAD